MCALSLLVRTRQAADAAALGTLEGVHSVDELGDNRYRVFHHPETSPAGAIAEAAVSAGWGLLELTPERRSMEQIFIDITQPTAAGAKRQ